MKTFRIGVIFCLVMCVACGPRPQLGTNVDRLIEIPNSNSIDTSKETTLKGYEVGSSTNRLLLEVVSSRFGMVLTQGRVLDLRVLDNGDAEADHIDAGGHVLRKQYTLNSDEMKTLQRMLTLPGVREAGPKYALEDACLDASYEREFILSIPDVPDRKSIVILECRPAKSDQTLKLPPEDVTMLLNFVDDLRSHKPSASDAIDNGLVLDAIDQFAALHLVKSLRTKRVSSDSIELRIWVGFSPDVTRGLLLNKRVDSCKSIYLPPELSDANKPRDVGERAGCAGLWSLIENSGFMNLPDDSIVGSVEAKNDSDVVIVEVKEGDRYHYFKYSSPCDSELTEAKLLVDTLAKIGSELSLEFYPCPRKL